MAAIAGTNILRQFLTGPKLLFSGLTSLLLFLGFSNHSLQAGTSKVIAWGANYDGQTNVPANLTNVVAISAGNTFALALKADGTVVGWGSGPFSSLPSVSNAVAISAGSGKGIVLRQDGTLMVVPSNASSGWDMPQGASNVIAISSGQRQDITLSAEETIILWGGGAPQTTAPDQAVNIIGIAASESHCVALDRNGRIFTWAPYGVSLVNEPIGLTNAVAVDAGIDYTLAIRRDGGLSLWKSAGYSMPSVITNIPSDVTDVVSASAGDYHVLAMKRDGKLYGWGSEWQTGSVVPSSATNITAFSAGSSFSVAISGEGPPDVTILNSSVNTINAGRTMVLRAGVIGEPPLTYQWRKGGTDLPGATAPSLTLTNVQSDDTASYTLFVSNRLGVSASQAVSLVVNEAPPTFVREPVSQLVLLMNHHKLTSLIVGSEPLTYQWHFNGVTLPGQTNPVLVLEQLRTADAGSYSISVNNSFGAAASSNAALSVSPVGNWSAGVNDVLPMAITLRDVVALRTRYNQGEVLDEEGNIQDWDFYSRGFPYVGSVVVSNVLEIGNDWGGFAIARDSHVVPLLPHMIDMPSGLTNAIGLAGGFNKQFVLLSEGKVVGWMPLTFGGFAPLTIPYDITNVVDIAFGDEHGLAIRSDGSLATWGDLDFGRLTIPAGLKNVSAIAAGANHSVALRRDGTIVCWGAGFYGETNVPAGLTNVVAIAAGRYHTAALKRDGNVILWGQDIERASNGFTRIKNVAKIAAGENQTAAIFWEGPALVRQLTPRSNAIFSGGPVVLRVDVVGPANLNFQWQLHGTNLPGATDRSLFVDRIRAEDADAFRFVATEPSGAAVSQDLELNVKNTPPFILKQPMDAATNVTRSAAFSAMADGSKPLHYQWMFEGNDIPGATSPNYTVDLLSVSQSGAYSLKITNLYGSVVSSNATLSVWPAVGWGRSLPDDFNQSEAGAVVSNAVGIAAGMYHSAVLKSDGTVSTWGLLTNTPTGLSNVVEIFAGRMQQAYNLAVLEDGTIRGWGVTTNSRLEVPAGTRNVISLTIGNYYNAAVQADGRVRVWGGSSPITNVPSTITNVAKIACGDYHVVALRRDGTVAAWGSGTATNVPVGITNVVAVAAGYNYGYAVRADGSVASWGTPLQNAAAVLPMLTNVVSIAGSAFHAVALRFDGTVVSWGDSSNGRTNVPIGLTNVVQIGAGSDYGWALRDDGKVFMWGDNTGGQHTLPTLLTNVIAVSHGVSHCLALTGSREPHVWSATASDAAAFTGQEILLRASAIGMPPMSYRWYLNGAEIPGATNYFFLVEKVGFGNAGNYSVSASNKFGSAISNVLISVQESAPTVVSQPKSVWSLWGTNASFEVTADGSRPLFYQWLYKGEPITDATNATLTVSNVNYWKRGAYAVIVSNHLGTTLSSSAHLQVSPVVVWGNGQYGQLTPPSAVSNAISLAAGASHGLALKRDGTLTAWGVRSNVPPNLTQIRQISASSSHSVALRQDGTVTAWFDASGSPSYTNSVITIPAGLSNVIAVSAGSGYSLALRSSGTVAAWGDTGYSNFLAGLSNVVNMDAAGGNYGLVSKRDGRVAAWGLFSTPTNPPSSATNITDVAASFDVAMGLRVDRTVIAWRSTGTVNPPAGWTNVVSISAGPNHALALRRDGTVSAWWLGSGSSENPQTKVPSGLSNVVAVAAGGDLSIALVSDELPFIQDLLWSETNLLSGFGLRLEVRAIGQPPLTYQWQLNGTNITGATNAAFQIERSSSADSGAYTVRLVNNLGTTISEPISVKVSDQTPEILVQPESTEIDILQSATFGVSVIGSLPIRYQWLFNGINIPGATNASWRVRANSLLEEGDYAVVVRNPFGTVVSSNATFQIRPISAWGYGGDGQTNIPNGVRQVLAVAGGLGHSLALRNDGRVVAWGANLFGQADVPSNLQNVAGIAAGPSNSLALRLDGTVVYWGLQSSPLPSISNAIAIAAGQTHYLALLSDQTVVAWGENLKGQTNVPASLSNVVSIAAGQAHSVALKQDGTVVVWGDNPFGRNTPPLNLVNVVDIAATSAETAALLSNGSVVAWGWGAAGTTNVPPGLTNAIAITGRSSYFLALKADGTVVYWGHPNIFPRLLPEGLTNVIALAAGDSHGLALVNDLRPAQWPMLIQRDSQTTSVSVPGLKGQTYALDWSASLSTPSWMEVDRIQGRAGIASLRDTNVVETQRFYRVRRQ